MGDGMLSLSWNNHSTTFCHMLTHLRQKDRYSDATLSCEGHFYPVHQLVLSTCSQYFEDMFEHTLGKHPMVVLQDVRRCELEALLSYMYAGVVSVAQKDLARLIKLAELLQIKGLAVPDQLPGETNAKVMNDKTHQPSRVGSTSDDRTSPHPKRKRMDSECTQNGTSHYDSAPTRTTMYPKDTHEIGFKTTDRPRPRDEETEVNAIRESQPEAENGPEPEIAWEEDCSQPVPTQEPSKPQFKETDDAVVIKEEALDENHTGAEVGYNSSVDVADSTDGHQEDHSNMSPEYPPHAAPPNQAPLAQLPQGAEAMAGPSGMQEWLTASDFSCKMEMYSGMDDGSVPNHPMPQTMVGLDSDSHRPLESTAISGEKNRESLQCPCCTYSTARKDHMKEHIRTHTGEKPFLCPQCPYRSAKNSDLHRHLQTHTGEKPFSCPNCSFRTTRKINLKNHMLTHASEKSASCPYCPYENPNARAMMIHMRSHGDQAYSCPYCQMRFTKRSSLNIHVRTHTQ